MNILIITYQGYMAGSTNSIAFLSMGLAEKGHKVCVGLKMDSLLWQKLEGSAVIRVPMNFNGRFSKTNIKEIHQVVTEHQIQIINAQSSLDRYTTAWAKWLYKLPVKIYHTRRQPPKSIGGLQNYFYKKVTEKIIVISDELKKIFLSNGFPESHLKVIYNGIPASRYEEWSQERVEEVKKIVNKKEGEFIIGCVARMKSQKQLIQAVEELNDPSIRLFFAGIEDWRLDKLKLSSKIKKQITVLGKIDGSDILNWYKAFDVKVLPSVTDGFGLVLVEAMAMECPVIATNFGGIKNVVRHNENGLLFDDGDIEMLKSQLKMLRHDTDLKSKLIKNGKITAFEEFTFSRTLEQYEQFFKSELGES